MIAVEPGTDVMLSIDEAAQRLGVSVMTIRRMVWRGDLPAYKIGGRLKFKDEELSEYIERRAFKPKESAESEGAESEGAE